MRKIKLLIISALFLVPTSCSKFLDIVPDNVASIESAFSLRASALRYLTTCYWYMPVPMNYSWDPAVGFWGGETWGVYPNNGAFTFLYARGEQNSVDPFFSFWTGTQNAKDLFQAIRECNVFLDNVGKVPDVSEAERNRWIGEIKFLKAYYHFYLLRMYGPVPLIKENLSIGADIEQVKRYREPVDECFDYIVGLLDEAIPVLPPMITDQQTEMGRITSVIAASVKAKILVTAASPLFNGNTDYADFVDNRGKHLFNATYDASKWDKAMKACEDALALTEQNGIKLYEFVPGPAETVSAKTKLQMNVRNVITEKWNQEIIWGWANESQSAISLAPNWDPLKADGVLRARGQYGPSIEFIELFYTKNGVPISEDNTWDYAQRYSTKVATAADKYEIENGYSTAKLNFDRESRFYGSVGFDGGVWYGQGVYNDNNAFVIKGKQGQHSGKSFVGIFSPTGYWHKKLIYYKNTLTQTGMDNIWYPTPVMRLSDLYLLYAEARNEVMGPDNVVMDYVDRIRLKAGLQTVRNAWTQFSRNPAKFTSKDGMREIIQREREIELAFEGHRYWDIKRWKRAETEFNKIISGWSLDGSTVADYYKKIQVENGYQQKFIKRNYFDPIKESAIISNENVKQNPGW